MAQLLQLLDPIPGLYKGVIAGPDRPHGGRLVPGIGLRAVLEVAVGAAWAVDAYVACGRNVGASVWLAHYGHDGDAGSCSHWLCFY
jgi:hypothetical protein